MVAFDFSKMLDAAAATSSQGDDSSLKYPLLYPGIGDTKVKLLFNAKSNTVFRLINRHEWLDKKKVPCLKTWGKDKTCPICDALAEVKALTGDENSLIKYKSKVRGIAFAHLVSTNYPLTGKNAPTPSDIVLFMFPWTVYQQFQSVILQAESDANNLAKLVATNVGFSFVVRRTPDNKYQAMLDAFGNDRTCKSDEEFEKLLESLDNLDDIILPASIESLSTEKMTEINNIAKEIRSRFLSSSGTSVKTGTQNVRPVCFGRINSGDIPEARCVACPVQTECSAQADYDKEDVPF